MNVRRPKKFILKRDKVASDKKYASLGVSPDVWIPPCPHIDKHDGEGLAQEEKVNKEGESNHGERAKEKHHDKVGRLPPKTSLFQHPVRLQDKAGVINVFDHYHNAFLPAVAVGEDHVEEKVKAKSTKEEKSCD